MIENFIAQVKQEGMARTNRYAIYFGIPASVDNFIQDLRTVTLFCDQVQLPGLNYSTVQNRTFGEFRETPYEKLYDAVNISFYVDTSMRVKLLFDKWINSIQDVNTRTFTYYNNYITDMDIEVLDLQDNVRYVLTLYECYPKNIGSIQLDNSSKDIMKMQVTMQYKYWKANVVEQISDGTDVRTEVDPTYINDFDKFQNLNQQYGNNGGTSLNPNNNIQGGVVTPFGSYRY
jgi:hypothetical protein